VQKFTTAGFSLPSSGLIRFKRYDTVNQHDAYLSADTTTFSQVMSGDVGTSFFLTWLGETWTPNGASAGQQVGWIMSDNPGTTTGASVGSVLSSSGSCPKDAANSWVYYDPTSATSFTTVSVPSPLAL